MGIPLLDADRAWQIWEEQRRHLPSIQDPHGVALYTCTGYKTKGNIKLPIYRCARGSTSLESFHLHIARFVPVTTANDVHFQSYLLDTKTEHWRPLTHHRLSTERTTVLCAMKSTVCAPLYMANNLSQTTRTLAHTQCQVSMFTNVFSLLFF